MSRNTSPYKTSLLRICIILCLKSYVFFQTAKWQNVSIFAGRQLNFPNASRELDFFILYCKCAYPCKSLLFVIICHKVLSNRYDLLQYVAKSIQIVGNRCNTFKFLANRWYSLQYVAKSLQIVGIRCNTLRNPCKSLVFVAIR